MAVTTEIETINLKTAKEYLDKNIVFERGKEDTNRPTSIRVINNYAREMLRGNWHLTHQGIGFDVRGRLKDGQHRLLALVQACELGASDGDEILEPNPKLTIRMVVTRGLDKDTFMFMDNGLVRSSSNVLAMSGLHNTTHLAACGRLLYLYDNYEPKFWRSTKVVSSDVLKTVVDNGLAEYLPSGIMLVQVGMIASAATVGYFLCVRSYPEGPHMEFIEALRNGVGLAGDSPALVLRNYLIRSRNGKAGTRREAYTHMALYIKAWNDFATGRRRNQISFRDNEPFPMPVETEDVKSNGR